MASFQVIQDGLVVAEGSGPAADVVREALHYAAVYRQDGPAQVVVTFGTVDVAFEAQEAPNA